MILSGLKIKEEVSNGNIIIESFDPSINKNGKSKLGPNSYNLTLHNKLLIYKDNILDMKKKNETEEIIIPEDGYILQPGQLYLARTNERTFTDKYVPMLEGRSSIGRLGLQIHITAGFGDIGFDGTWTLEMQCIKPLKIYPNTQICQIYYYTIDGDFDLYKGSKYQGQIDVTPSKLHEDLNI